jgi:hypothetical protein
LLLTLLRRLRLPLLALLERLWLQLPALLRRRQLLLALLGHAVRRRSDQGQTPNPYQETALAENELLCTSAHR